MQDVNLEIQLFGAFRTFSAQPVKLQVPSGLTAAAVKTRLGEVLVSQLGAPAERVEALLAASPLATASAVLGDTALIDQSQSLAILPPVCGG